MPGNRPLALVSVNDVKSGVDVARGPEPLPARLRCCARTPLQARAS